jgi:hypothetical protein
MTGIENKVSFALARSTKRYIIQGEASKEESLKRI